MILQPLADLARQHGIDTETARRIVRDHALPVEFIDGARCFDPDEFEAALRDLIARTEQ